jgi:G patch domain-containing protein 1
MTNRQKPRKKRPTDDDPEDDMPGGPDPTITLIGTRFETEEETAKMTRRQREEVNKDKYVPIYKQELKDEKGRKVLPQGAFKGGRVAGFNNTVGSAQGWAPSQFVSSRNNRASGASGQQATDFMDEEDFEEMGLGAKDVSAASDFDTFGSSRGSKT